MGVSQELEKLRLAQIGTEISAEMRAIAQVSFCTGCFSTYRTFLCDLCKKSLEFHVLRC
jgi:predicted amidophosphoribosyltransferase